MAGEAAARLPTFDELYARIERLEPGMTGEILEPGVLRVMSRPGRAHRHAHEGLAVALGGSDRGLGGKGWWIELEPEVRFDPVDRMVQVFETRDGKPALSASAADDEEVVLAPFPDRLALARLWLAPKTETGG